MENEDQFTTQLINMEMAEISKGQPMDRVVCDFIASMTDRYAINLYEKLFLPSPLV
jgi:dGTPase